MRKVLTGLAAAGLTLALTACGQSANGAGDGAGGGDTKGGLVGIAMPTKSSERWINDGDNMVKQFQAKGYKTDLQYGDNVVENQV